MKLYSVKVKKIIYEASGFAILGIEKLNGVVTIKLTASEIPKALKSVRYDFSGDFVKCEKYGKQFVSDGWTRTPKQKTSSEIRAGKDACNANKYI